MTKPKENLEVWMRGPIAGLAPLLQPVAHAILQAREEVNLMMIDFPDELIWERPSGVASVAFHLQHLSGVLDRLFTYANNQILNEDQLELLALEADSTQFLTVKGLLTRFNNQVNKALTQLKNIDEKTLLEPRGIGRKQIPTNLLGLLFHAAEHTQRHTGQLYVTVRILQNS
ncbi:DinB family protein [Arcicella aurantiaca]|uniref:DinB family protein n=1 Tax=Arcicella aurantiaca TaxID=591202 RepID=A0A316E916_9BACT|nr:DinB family protein [Arcicella aurantiaca]PWK26859.1 DinB family protein [Arcicella aurantiaca]